MESESDKKTEDVRSSWFVPSVHHALTTDEVKQVTDDLGFHCSPDLVDVMTEQAADTLKTLSLLDNQCGYLPEVKYPRTPGRKPAKEENPGNAWAWLCDVPGAKEGKLSGKRVAIKDNVAVAGVPMSNGSHVLDGYVPEYDATIVTRILDAGGHIVGKSACDGFCCSSMGMSSTDGFQHLPQTQGLRVGGSSGGSAVLVATGAVDLAIGGDQGGSIRIPSAWAGIVGLKPTYGLVPYTGIVCFEPTLDHTGPMARNVTDCALLLDVLAGNDGIDPRQKADVDVPEYSKLLDTERPTTMILGRVQEGFEKCQSRIASFVSGFLNNAAKHDGIDILQVTVPLHKMASIILTPIGYQGGTTCLKMGTAPQFVEGFHSTSLLKAVEQGNKCSARRFTPAMQLTGITGEILTRRYGNHYYAKARNVSLKLRQQVDEVLDKCDVLVMPTVLHLSPLRATREPSEKEDWNRFLRESFNSYNTCVFNLTGHPALTIPLGPVGDPSLPGLMIVGKRFHELKVLQVGRALEKIVHSQLDTYGTVSI